jgi:hypothetical protein
MNTLLKSREQELGTCEVRRLCHKRRTLQKAPAIQRESAEKEREIMRKLHAPYVNSGLKLEVRESRRGK